MKWLVDTMGLDELQARILKERKFLVASLHWPGGIPEAVAEARRRARRARPRHAHADGPGHAGRRSARDDPTRRWDDANVVRGVAKGTVSAFAYARLGDITTDQFRALASIQRELGAEVRITNRQNLVFRGLSESQLPAAATSGSTAIGMAEPGAELSRDVVACPGADTCNLAVTQSRGPGRRHRRRPRRGRPGRRRRHPHQHLRLHQQLRPAPHLRHRLLRRRAPGPRPAGSRLPAAARRLRRPGARSTSARRRCACPAKNAPEAVCAWSRRFNNEREAGEVFRSWMDRVRRGQGHRRGPPRPRGLTARPGWPPTPHDIIVNRLTSPSPPGHLPIGAQPSRLSPATPRDAPAVAPHGARLPSRRRPPRRTAGRDVSIFTALDATPHDDLPAGTLRRGPGRLGPGLEPATSRAAGPPPLVAASAR